MEQFLVCLSDRRPDLVAAAGDETTADVWCYEIEAGDAAAAVAPAVARWRAEVGERAPVSLTVSRL